MPDDYELREKKTDDNNKEGGEGRVKAGWKGDKRIKEDEICEREKEIKNIFKCSRGSEA